MEKQAEQNAIEELNARITSTKERIIDILALIDDIKLQQNPQIEADYAVKIGYLENALLESELAMRRAKRKLSLIQARINSDSVVDMQEIESTLDAEFEEWRQRSEAAMARYYELLVQRAGSTLMAPADAKELKALYRRICKRLHPDVCDPEDADTHLFFIAQQAYASGDLAVLRSLAEVIGDAKEGQQPQSADEANAQLALLEAQLALHEEELARVKAEFPYSIKELLADPQWVTMRVRELKARCREFDEAYARYEARIAQITREGDCDE